MREALLRRASKDARQGAGPVSFEARIRSHLTG
jgi:hypothetical protein